MLKRIINTLAITASLAFASAANAGLITNNDDAYLMSLVSDGTVVTQNFNGTDLINYQYKDNYLLLDFQIQSIEYFEFQFANNQSEDVYLNAYSSKAYDFGLFDSSFNYLVAEFSDPMTNNIKIVFEIDSQFQFTGLDLINNQSNYTNISFDFAPSTSSGFMYDAPLANHIIERVNKVPEPSTLATFALAMFGLASRKLNKKS